MLIAKIWPVPVIGSGSIASRTQSPGSVSQCRAGSARTANTWAGDCGDGAGDDKALLWSVDAVIEGPFHYRRVGMSGLSSQPEYVGRDGHPSGNPSHSSCRPYGSRSISAKEWLELFGATAVGVPGAVARYRRHAGNTLTAKPSPGAASTSAPKELSDDEYQSIRLPTLSR